MILHPSHRQLYQSIRELVPLASEDLTEYVISLYGACDEAVEVRRLGRRVA